MGLIRDSFVFFKSFHEATKDLPADLYKEVMTAFATYALSGEYPEMSATCKGFLMLAKPNIDNANNNYRASVENGKKGGNPNFKKGKSNPYYGKNNYQKDNLEITQEITKDNQNLKQDNPRDNLNDDVNVNENEKNTHTAGARVCEDFQTYTIFDIIEICKTECPVVYNRHHSKPNADYALGQMLDELRQTVTLEEIRQLLQKANKTYTVQPRYNTLDLLWILNNPQKIINAETIDEQPNGGQSRPSQKKQGMYDTLNEVFADE